MRVHFSDGIEDVIAEDVFVVGHFLLVYTEPDLEVRLYPADRIEMVSAIKPEEIQGLLRNGYHTE